MTNDFLKEVIYHKLVKGLVVNCFGISQNPKSGNYVIVTEYMKNGNLREYMRRNYNKLGLNDKLNFLYYITRSLSHIHTADLVHRDLHPGNVLIDHHKFCRIADLGLSRPASENDETKIYGVLPYVAPEVLREKKYTQASDIYS